MTKILSKMRGVEPLVGAEALADLYEEENDPARRNLLMQARLKLLQDALKGEKPAPKKPKRRKAAKPAPEPVPEPEPIPEPEPAPPPPPKKAPKLDMMDLSDPSVFDVFGDLDAEDEPEDTPAPTAAPPAPAEEEAPDPFAALAGLGGDSPTASDDPFAAFGDDDGDDPFAAFSDDTPKAASPAAAPAAKKDEDPFAAFTDDGDDPFAAFGELGASSADDTPAAAEAAPEENDPFAAFADEGDDPFAAFENDAAAPAEAESKPAEPAAEDPFAAFADESDDPFAAFKEDDAAPAEPVSTPAKPEAEDPFAAFADESDDPFAAFKEDDAAPTEPVSTPVKPAAEDPFAAFADESDDPFAAFKEDDAAPAEPVSTPAKPEAEDPFAAFADESDDPFAAFKEDDAAPAAPEGTPGEPEAEPPFAAFADESGDPFSELKEEDETTSETEAEDPLAALAAFESDPEALAQISEDLDDAKKEAVDVSLQEEAEAASEAPAIAPEDEPESVAAEFADDSAERVENAEALAESDPFELEEADDPFAALAELEQRGIGAENQNEDMFEPFEVAKPSSEEDSTAHLQNMAASGFAALTEANDDLDTPETEQDADDADDADDDPFAAFADLEGEETAPTTNEEDLDELAPADEVADSPEDIDESVVSDTAETSDPKGFEEHQEDDEGDADPFAALAGLDDMELGSDSDNDEMFEPFEIESTVNDAESSAHLQALASNGFAAFADDTHPEETEAVDLNEEPEAAKNFADTDLTSAEEESLSDGLPEAQDALDDVLAETPIAADTWAEEKSVAKDPMPGDTEVSDVNDLLAQFNDAGSEPAEVSNTDPAIADAPEESSGVLSDEAEPFAAFVDEPATRDEETVTAQIDASAAEEDLEKSETSSTNNAADHPTSEEIEPSEDLVGGIEDSQEICEDIPTVVDEDAFELVADDVPQPLGEAENQDFPAVADLVDRNVNAANVSQEDDDAVFASLLGDDVGDFDDIENATPASADAQDEQDEQDEQNLEEDVDLPLSQEPAQFAQPETNTETTQDDTAPHDCASDTLDTLSELADQLGDTRGLEQESHDIVEAEGDASIATEEITVEPLSLGDAGPADDETESETDLHTALVADEVDEAEELEQALEALAPLAAEKPEPEPAGEREPEAAAGGVP
ncbi:MAG: hypothetical protein N4A58_17415, partial [Donghicola sp.]|nr:hypothetical protein [Donghicola sp.]